MDCINIAFSCCRIFPQDLILCAVTEVAVDTEAESGSCIESNESCLSCVTLSGTAHATIFSDDYVKPMRSLPVVT